MGFPTMRVCTPRSAADPGFMVVGKKQSPPVALGRGRATIITAPRRGASDRGELVERRSALVVKGAPLLGPVLEQSSPVAARQAAELRAGPSSSALVSEAART